MSKSTSNSTLKPSDVHARERAGTSGLLEDEVSLGELYLIFKRGLPWIISAALLAGALAFAAALRHTPIFQARATVSVSPLPELSFGADGAELPLSSGALPFEAYSVLAKRAAVLEDAVARLRDAPETSGLAVTPAQLGAASRVGERTRPNRYEEGDPLVFTHVVLHAEPQMAAALANAWTASVLEAVYDLRAANLTAVEEAARAQAAAHREALQSAEPSGRAQLEAALQTANQIQARADLVRDLVPTTAQLLERATVPAAPLPAPSTSRIVLAALAGALLAAFVVFVRAAFTRTPRRNPPSSSASHSQPLASQKAEVKP